MRFRIQNGCRTSGIGPRRTSLDMLLLMFPIDVPVREKIPQAQCGGGKGVRTPGLVIANDAGLPDSHQPPRAGLDAIPAVHGMLTSVVEGYAAFAVHASRLRRWTVSRAFLLFSIAYWSTAALTRRRSFRTLLACERLRARKNPRIATAPIAR